MMKVSSIISKDVYAKIKEFICKKVFHCKGVPDNKKQKTKEDYWVYDRTFESTGGTFRVDKRLFELSKYIQEKNRKALHPEENKTISDDEKIIQRFTPCGGKQPTKEELLARHQPLGSQKLTWEMFKSKLFHTPPLG